jgi:rhamnosyltransferase
MNPLIIVPLFRPNLAKVEALCSFFYASSVDVIFYCNSRCKAVLGDVLLNYPNRFSVAGSEDNLGTASAYNYALRLLLASKSYSHMVIFDQDSLPRSDFFRVARAVPAELLATAVICPPDSKSAYSREFFSSPVGSSQYRFLYHAKASGMIIPRFLFEESRLQFCENLFVDYVDWVFCWQARQRGFSIIESRNLCLLNHSLGDSYALFGMRIQLPSRARRVLQARSAWHLIRNWRLFDNAPLSVIARICFRPLILKVIDGSEAIGLLATVGV